MRRFLRTLSLLGWSAFLVAAPVLAQEGKPSPADSPIGWVYRWINFAVVAGLIIWGFSKLTPYFRQHAMEISGQIAEGARAREAAEAKSREAQAKMAALEGEISALRAEARRDSEAEVARLRAQTKEEAGKVEQSARMEIEAVERAARLELKSLVARMAVQRAEALLRDRITPQVEASLLKSYVAELNRRVQPGQAGAD